MQPSEPMLFPATCEGWRVRSGGGGPNQPKTKNQKKQQRMNHSLLSKTNTNSAPKSNVTTRTAGIKNTYRRDAVLSNETDEPKMTKARCNLRRRCRSLQCVRDGEGGAAVAAPIKPETKNQSQNQSKAHETCPAQCNKRKLSSRKQHNDNNTLYPKTLTAEKQFFQMRKMNQR